MVIMADWEPVWHRGIDFSHSVSLINMLKWKASILPSLVISVSFSRSNEKDQMTSDVAGVVPRSNTSVVHKWCVLWKSDQQNGLHTRHSWKTVYYSGRDWGFSVNHHRYVQTLHFFRFNFQLYADDDVVLLIGLVFQALGLGLGKIMFRMIIPDFIWLFASCPWL